MNILFISQFYPDNLLPVFTRKTISGLDYAAHNLNLAILEGFRENGICVDVLNVPHLGSFPPFYKFPYVEGSLSDDCHVKSLSYINVSYYKRIDINRRLKKNIKIWCNNTKGEKLILFYNFTGLQILPSIKEMFNDVKACLIVTDLPEFMAVDNSVPTRINKFIAKHIIPKDKSYYNAIDGYILLAPGMAERLPIGGRPWIHVEGIYNSECDNIKVEKSTEKVILYTGNLGERYGIKQLLEAFSMITDPDYRLWIRGSGECEKEVSEASKNDSRIVYYPPMSKADLMTLQKKATALINPVFSSLEFTRYFFPSKTLEYLASGTPTIMSKLDCIPEDYSPYVYFLSDDSVEAIKNKMIEVCEKPDYELLAFGHAASSFIRSHKTPFPQVRRILEFLEQL